MTETKIKAAYILPGQTVRLHNGKSTIEVESILKAEGYAFYTDDAGRAVMYQEKKDLIIINDSLVLDPAELVNVQLNKEEK